MGETITVFGRELPRRPGYLNTASIGVPTLEASAAVAETVRRWAVAEASPKDFDDDVEAARAGFATITGVPVADVAQGATTSGLIGPLAAAVPDGTRVLVAAGEFSSVTRPFALQAHRGVRVTEVPLAELAGNAPGHDLVAVSVVQSADGRIADLDALGAVRERHGVRLLLDVTQAAGWLPLRLAGADAVVGAGYKWLLGPRGTAWLAQRPSWVAGPPGGERWPEVVRHSAGWYGTRDRWGGGLYTPDPPARPGPAGGEESPVWFAHAGSAVTVPWLASVDPEALRAHCAGLADALRERLGLEPTGSAIVSVRADGAADRLAAAGITAAVRDGAARLAFHLANTPEDVDLAAAALRD
ncbi:Cysteine desulfurase [Pseudonocardia sp. Ae168_Ps1]|uniref:aminotransferase class V-fold PLP-dependent enzyme n=1 Tax=unclassified Pseudonocardia TaxID=2619320 RepID=UPI00095CA270|nr:MULTISPECIES: aminotransferase class V-fold PLP-dependent enzyme [unclassified Pseudonocardia]OLL76703.1 Cysteine desulfurase [Pseudonocardia sp. Ae150A_Ps1]OLL82715.1 Cysteine desulfurase [Pseudonocardia sp. Ae168_Ps1]OLL83172.1 Cysteine desulfurase [Pseudonocardia sp. Ae263_Ps1]OLL90790.1 Cysteine desulfurase [Pseudonocardia sp. Ae356_Ps1]